MEICYDLRFPEMHRLLVEKGAKVLLFPAAFTVPTGRDHWCEFRLCRLVGLEVGVDFCLCRYVAGKLRTVMWPERRIC